jgi:hypothetical protein
MSVDDAARVGLKQTAKPASNNPPSTRTNRANNPSLILPSHHIQRQRLDPVRMPRTSKRLEPRHA